MRAFVNNEIGRTEVMDKCPSQPTSACYSLQGTKLEYGRPTDGATTATLAQALRHR
jgi:hypothetical protein